MLLSDQGTNSGVFLHTPPVPTNPAVDCYELNIADAGTNPFPTGSFVGRALAASATDGRHDHLRWQTFDIRVEGGSVSVWLDEALVLEYEDPRPLGRGFIGLQYNSGRAAFASVRLRPLGTRSFAPQGESLEGWIQYPEMEGQFERKEETLHVSGGPGQLETVQSYRDFVMQIECRTNAAELNSGIFFRCIPGERMNGYESQIHNGILEGDPTQPADFGTGGIFRRQPARFVNAEDRSWFYKTIIACDSHFSVWVNGLQVTDWTDQRAADANPRRGLRRQPGTIMLQAHDETTDIEFRQMTIGEMRRRNR